MRDGRREKGEGRREKPKEIMRPDEQAAAAVAAADCASAPAKKKKLNKIVWPEAAAQVADNASTCPQRRRKRKRKRKRKSRRRKEEEGENQEERKQYLVIRHTSRDPTYSLIVVKRSEKTADHPVPSPYRVAFLDGEFDMGFAAMCTDRRSWIVGVGGFPGRKEDGPPLRQVETIVFDCKTEAIAKGPPPTSPKYLPLAFAVGPRVYALTRIPSIWAVPNGPPWFEVLDLSDAACVDGRLTNCSWRTLTAPPLFPVLDEEELDLLDEAPWSAIIESYAVVGRYILLSSAVGGPCTGTVAFDVSEEKWYFVDCENLPFIGEAVPYGRLFLGRSRSKEFKDLTAYYINVEKMGSERKLSVVEVALTLIEDDSPATYAQFFSCLGNGVLCATGCGTKGPSCCGVEKEDEDLYIRLYKPVKAEEGDEEIQRGGIVLSSKDSVYYLGGV